MPFPLLPQLLVPFKKRLRVEPKGQEGRGRPLGAAFLPVEGAYVPPHCAALAGAKPARVRAVNAMESCQARSGDTTA